MSGTSAANKPPCCPGRDRRQRGPPKPVQRPARCWARPAIPLPGAAFARIASRTVQPLIVPPPISPRAVLAAAPAARWPRMRSGTTSRWARAPESRRSMSHWPLMRTRRPTRHAHPRFVPAPSPQQSEWLKTHAVGDRSLAQGLKVRRRPAEPQGRWMVARKRSRRPPPAAEAVRAATHTPRVAAAGPLSSPPCP